MRRLTSAAEISLGGITAHHAVRGEDCTDLADRALHYACPAGWIAMKQGQHRAFELLIERPAMGLRRIAFLADGPPRDAFNAALDPPAVEHAQARHAIECRLHPTGARRLQRWLRRVEPDIGTRHQLASQGDVVVREKGHWDVVPQALDVT